MNKKRELSIIIFSLLFIFGTILIFTIPTGIKSTYFLTTQTEDGEIISFNVFEPINGDNNKKAIIIGHGYIVNKEILKGYAIELAEAGFVAIPFDFRGHGTSSGELGRGNLTADVRAIITYLANRGDIDMNNLGYIGYSMGGSPGLEITYENTAFKCFIGIGTWLSTTYTRIGNSTHPMNILMILGKFDEVGNLDRLKESFGYRLGLESDEVVANRLYGSFNEGNASKIFYDDNADHLTTAWDEDFIREARDWVISTFSDVKPINEDLFVNIRFLILIMQLIGGIGFFFIIIEPLSPLILKSKKKKIKKLELIKMSISDLSKRIISYTFLWFFVGILISIPILIFLPLALASFFLVFLFGQAFAMLKLLSKIAKESGFSFYEIFKRPFKNNRKVIFRQIILGTILASLFLIVLVASTGLNYLGMLPSIYRLPFIPIYFIGYFFVIISFSMIFQMILQEKFGKGLKEIIKSAFLNFGLLMIYIGGIILTISIILNNFFMAIMLILAAPILLFVSLSSSFLYEKTGTIIPAAIVNALFITCLVGTLSPHSDIIGLLGIFFL
jgi:pimeloyl-ACP methyl ester carboxylesterase